MDRLLPGLAITVFALLLLALMYWAWRGRKRRQQAFATTTAAPAELGTELASAEVLYVATTKAGEPLERLTIPGLTFRGRGRVTVFTTGVRLVIPGEPETFIASDRLRSVGTSTWAIDRVVESGGLVRLDWTFDSTAGPADVESYLRATELGDARLLIDAATTVIPQQEGTSS
ncbi:MAG: hypothetical protein Q7T71_09270 [Herbiconiux sp.]|nr:hypothetical protein [Herbiconiux sp.]